MTLFSQLVPNASLVTANSTQTLTNKTLNSPILVTPNLGVASANSITANLGAVGTPSYTFTGDLNTGMWSPAADTLAFSEGGVEAMRITSDGNVGIGTSAPNVKLHVEGGSVRSSVSFIISGVGALQTSIAGAGLALSAAGATGITFETGGTRAERMRIDSSGNVGIGTASPGYKLDVSATGNISGQFKTSGSINALFLADANTTAETLYVGTVGNDFRVVTGSNERMRINSSGNVGIGTSAPSAKLNVAGDTIISGNADARQIGFNFYGTSQYNFYVDGATDAAKMTIRRGTTSVATFDTNGNVGIGVTPSAWVTYPAMQLAGGGIMGAGSDLNLSANGYFNAGWKRIATGEATLYNQSAGVHSWYNAVSSSAGSAISLNERMRITADGNVRIGSTSGGARLSVVSTLSTNLLIEKNSLPEAYSPGTFSFKNAYMPSGTQENWVAASSASTVAGYLIDITAYNGASASDVYFGAEAGPAVGSGGPANFVFGRRTGTQTWAETMRIDNVGNVGIGTASPGYKLSVAGTLEVTAVKEGVFTITDGAINLDPNNGSIQLWTLGASRTPSQANWATGQSITLMIDDGAAYAVTWSTLAVVWKTGGGTAPTLNTTGFTIITLWKVGTTIYGARVGDA